MANVRASVGIYNTTLHLLEITFIEILKSKGCLLACLGPPYHSFCVLQSEKNHRHSKALGGIFSILTVEWPTRLMFRKILAHARALVDGPECFVIRRDP